MIVPELSDPDTRRARRISLAVLLFACALVALSCAQSAYRLLLPTEGWDYFTPEDTATNTVIFSRNLLGEPTPLRQGDRLVAINGAPYAEEGLAFPMPLDRQFFSDGVARYTVRRDGQVLDLVVPLKRWTLGAVLAYRFPTPAEIISFAAGWFLFGLSIFVLRRRPAELAARALLLGLVSLQALFVRFTGQESTLAVVASTLAIAALFGPLRRWVQGLIDRRFFRRKYDARQVLEAFALRAQKQADLDALSADVLQVVQETVEPERAQLWLLRRQ